jgi:hypothetical protein
MNIRPGWPTGDATVRSNSKQLLVIAAALAMSGCAGASLPSMGSITGNSKSISESDRVFLMAAGSWDRNKDNQVTCDEWKAYATELFNGAEANGDDAIDETEWARIVAVDRMFSTADVDYYDANNDNKVSRAEFVDRPNTAFRLLDPQGTCVLTGDQVAGARSKTEYDLSGVKKESDPTATKNPDVLGRDR